MLLEKWDRLKGNKRVRNRESDDDKLPEKRDGEEDKTKRVRNREQRLQADRERRRLRRNQEISDQRIVERKQRVDARSVRKITVIAHAVPRIPYRGFVFRPGDQSSFTQQASTHGSQAPPCARGEE